MRHKIKISACNTYGYYKIYDLEPRDIAIFTEVLVKYLMNCNVSFHYFCNYSRRPSLIIAFCKQLSPIAI